MKAAQERRVQDIEAATLRSWMERGEALLVDVREPAEHAGERIPGATLVPLSTFDPAQVRVESGKKLVLHCVMGQRSTQAGNTLLAAGFPEVHQLRGGIQAWKEAGYPVEQSQHAPISLQRQVQMVAGACVLLGTLLGAFVSPWFLILSGFFGAGLLFAGITNTCGMAMLLAKLPYNQRA
jgi:rhodanese-related sulfurtransferase